MNEEKVKQRIESIYKKYLALTTAARTDQEKKKLQKGFDLEKRRVRFGAEMQRRRKEAGKTQEQLGASIGKSKSLEVTQLNRYLIKVKNEFAQMFGRRLY